MTLQATLPELYETISAGGKFQMQFHSKEDAINFRAKLATHKHRTEKDLKLMGVIEHMTLTMTWDEATNVATFYTREPVQQQQTYEILSITPHL